MDIILLIATLAITLIAQGYINSKYSETRKIKSLKGLSGKEVAERILRENNLTNVRVEETRGVLSDHYDPKHKVVRLSPAIYEETSLASISVASHECGHAIQDKDNYQFLRFRSSLIPFVNIASTFGYIAIMIGLFAGIFGFIWIGIFMECIILLFQLITLPVEFDASNRALKEIKKLGMVEDKELSKCRGMLTAAALTYVASVLTSILQIIRLLGMVNRRD
ncbi:MAG: zinc metallopeptidase [Bacilli bacterium]|nr:zinc metallopeptidase [Bacilli bacterium]